MDLKKGNQRSTIENKDRLEEIMFTYLLLFKYNKITGNSYLKLNAKINVSLYLFTLKHKHIHIN